MTVSDFLSFFSRKNLLEGGFAFQWGHLFFRWVGLHFLVGGGTPWGASVLMEGFSKKIVGWGAGHPPMPPP